MLTLLLGLVEALVQVFLGHGFGLDTPLQVLYLALFDRLHTHGIVSCFLDLPHEFLFFVS